VLLLCLFLLKTHAGGIFNMRLDKYLKVSRLIKRRSVANEACDATRVTANGRPVKASYQVKVGDILAIQFGEKTLKVEVLVVADNVGKNDASAMYREVL
jgi:ribosomal 50S subunit-recycling heat shock protein